MNRLSRMTSFSIGRLPLSYLGVHIFKGRTKASYLQVISDKIISKFSARKESLLTMAGRVLLVKSTTQNMIMRYLIIYYWPISLLKTIEITYRYFIWSGDINYRKMVTISWKKVYSSYANEGLGIRSLLSLNEATNLKLGWDMMASDES